ncbi:HDOD domain-containing protein [bacterium]|nr:HDOD domain-containing protein [bacterium]
MKDEIRHKVMEELQLDPLPEAALRVQNLVDQPDTTAKELSSVIATDSTLTALLLKHANSPLYGFSKKIGTVALAVVVLGFDTVREIVMSTAAMNTVSTNFTGKNVSTRRFWSHSLAVASGARVIAQHWRTSLPGEAFVAGLMHDLGRLVLATEWPAAYKAVLSRSYEKGIPTHVAEKKVMEVDHAEVAGWMGERWNLPEKILLSIREHHNLDVVRDNSAVCTIYLANGLAHREGFGHSKREPAPRFDEQALTLVPGFDERSLAKEMREAYFKAESFLEIVSGS